MPIITNRDAVLGVYAEYIERGRVIPTFNAENLTTIEAILTAALQHAEQLNEPDLPISIGITYTYPDRPQASYFTHSRRPSVGLDLFISNIRVLTGPNSPYSLLRVMIHLDHIQPGIDDELLNSDLARFSSIMFDASIFEMEENIARTSRFVEAHKHDIVIEGACDHIGKASLTSPDQAYTYQRSTGVDWLVCNLGTEHRAGSMSCAYQSELAGRIAERVGHRLVLHGTSSVPPDRLGKLHRDGVLKVNVWTALERDTAPILLEHMIRNASSVVGSKTAQAWFCDNLLGSEVDCGSDASLMYYPTTARQQIIHKGMAEIIMHYLQLWCPSQ